MSDNEQASRDRYVPGVVEPVHGGGKGRCDATRASARLADLDIDIVHRQSPNGDWEQISINLRATPSFEALGSSFEAANPFTFWVQATRFMWIPWLLTAQTMMLPASRPRTLPSVVHPEQEAPTANG